MPKRKAPESGETEGKGDRRFRYMKWAELLKRTFAIDLLCPKCREPMKLVALVTETESVKRFLGALGEATEAPPRAPAALVCSSPCARSSRGHTSLPVRTSRVKT